MVFRFFFALNLWASLAQANDNLRIDLSREFIEEAMNQPIHETEPIAKSKRGAAVNGETVTDGTSSIALEESKEWASIRIMASARSVSNATAFVTQQRMATYHVQLQTVATSAIAAEKYFYLSPDKFYTTETRSVAPTSLVCGDPSVQLELHFPRLFSGKMRSNAASKKALEEFYSHRAQDEKEIEAEAISKTNKKLNDQVDPRVSELFSDYHKFFYKPLFRDGGIPGRLAISSTTSALSLSVLPNKPLEEAWLKAVPAMPRGKMLDLRAHTSFFVDAAEKDLAGKGLNEEDLEEFFIKNGIPSGLSHYDPKSEQIVMNFSKNHPLTVRLSKGKATVQLQGDSLFFSGKEFVRPAILARYQIILEKGKVSFLRVGGPKVRATDLNDDVKTEVTARFGRIFPESFSFGGMAFPTKKNEKAELAVRNIQADQDWLVVEWEIKK